MTRRLLALSLILTIALCAQANKNFMPGMVVTSLGDTLTGLIDYQNWDQSPESIMFCRQLDDEVVLYRPTDLKLFKVAGEIYVGTEIDIENSSRQIEQLSFEPTLQLSRKSVFLRALVIGPRSLYHFKDSNSNDLFYIEIDSTYKLLGYKLYYNFANDVKNVRVLNKFIGQLNYYMNDQPKLKKTIQNVTYTTNSLTTLFNSYNKLVNPNMSYQRIMPMFKINYGLSAVAAINTIRYSGSIFPELVNLKSSPEFSYTPGIFIEFIEARNRGRLSLYSEFLYTTYKHNEHHENNRFMYRTNLEYSYLEMCNLLRYRILINNASLFVNGGALIGYLMHEINNNQLSSEINPVWHNNGTIIYDIKKYEIGMVFGGGIIYKHITLEARSVVGDGMSKYINLKSETRSNSLSVSYRF